MAGPRKRSHLTTRDFGKVERWEKDRFSTTLLRAHITLLRELSEDVGLPISTLLTQAVDNFLVSIGRQDAPLMPETNIKDYLSKMD